MLSTQFDMQLSKHSGPRARVRQLVYSSGSALLFALALACSGGGGGGGGSEQDGQLEVEAGTVIGQLEVVLPTEEQFILHGTLPLPAGLHVPGSDQIPLVVMLHDGEAAWTQVDGVSRFSDSANDGFDVVEVSAKVTRPEGSTPGSRLAFDVQYAPHADGGFFSSSDADDLLEEEDNISLRARDVFGNEYRADLLAGMPESGGRRVVREGPVVREWHTHSLLVPVSPTAGPQGTLPRLLAVHAFIRQYRGEDFVAIDLQVHNGMSGLDDDDDRDDAYNEVYFDSLELRLPERWSTLHAFEDPMIGEDQPEGSWVRHPLVDSLDGGDMHVLRRQGQFVRRLVVAPFTAQGRARLMLERQGLAFALPGVNEAGDPLFSWSNPQTAAYFPQDFVLPSLAHLSENNLRAQLEDELQDFVQLLADGQADGYPMLAPNLGYAQPWGAKYGGMTGGTEIDLCAGAGTVALRSHAGYRMAELQVRTTLDRQPHGLWDLDGEPTDLEDWLLEGNSGSYFPGYFNGTPILPHNDPFGFGDAPTAHIDEVVGTGKKPSYQDELLSYKPIDCQHWTRLTRNLKALAWIGNDSLAKNELAMTAALYRLTAHEYPISPHGLTQGHALSGQEEHVASLPGQGLGFGRASGWGIDVTAAAYALGDDQTRQRYYGWFTRIADVVEAGQSTCSGYLQAQPHHSEGGQYRIRQAYEAAITDNGLRSMTRCAFVGRDDTVADRVNAVLLERAYGSISPAFWSAADGAQFNTVAVGPHDSSLAAYCGDAEDVWVSGSLERKYTWNMLAYSYLQTEDPEFLAKALEMADEPDLFGYAQYHAYSDLENRVAFIAGVQALNAVE